MAGASRKGAREARTGCSPSTGPVANSCACSAEKVAIDSVKSGRLQKSSIFSSSPCWLDDWATASDSDDGVATAMRSTR